MVGAPVGFLVGAFVGFLVGSVVGFLVGAFVGKFVGAVVGFLVGAVVGFLVGALVAGQSEGMTPYMFHAAWYPVVKAEFALQHLQAQPLRHMNCGRQFEFEEISAAHAFAALFGKLPIRMVSTHCIFS